MCEEVRKEILRRVAKGLREQLGDVIPAAHLEAVVALGCRQLEYSELACPGFCKKVALLPGDGQAREEQLHRWADELCRDVLGSTSIRDCERVARFLVPGTSEADRQEIVRQFQLEYMSFVYGGAWNEQRDAPGGLLGARLIHSFGKREAGVLFAQAQQMLDEKLFSVEGFSRCAAEYDPAKGKKFGNFLKQRIRWRVGDVIRTLRRGREQYRGKVYPEISKPGGMENIASQAEKDPLDRQDRGKPLELLRRCLQRYREQSGSVQAEKEVAAYELRWKAYWDPEEMSVSTQGLVGSEWERLKQEFRDCQQRYRQLEEVELAAAQLRCQEAAQELEWVRTQLEKVAQPGIEIEVLEGEASLREMTELRAEWNGLGYRDREGLRGLKLRYQIAWKSLARARGKLERVRVEITKWEARRKPWIRSEEEIAKLLGVSQESVSRYIQRVEAFLQANCRRIS